MSPRLRRNCGVSRGALLNSHRIDVGLRAEGSVGARLASLFLLALPAAARSVGMPAAISPARADDVKDPYPAMAPVAQYMMNRAVEIALARTAAPALVSDKAEILVLDAHGYETAVKGTNGFVCYVGRSWENDFSNAEFWNPKNRAPECVNAVAARWY